MEAVSSTHVHVNKNSSTDDNDFRTFLCPFHQCNLSIFLKFPLLYTRISGIYLPQLCSCPSPLSHGERGQIQMSLSSKKSHKKNSCSSKSELKKNSEEVLSETNHSNETLFVKNCSQIQMSLSSKKSPKKNSCSSKSQLTKTSEKVLSETDHSNETLFVKIFSKDRDSNKIQVKETLSRGRVQKKTLMMPVEIPTAISKEDYADMGTGCSNSRGENSNPQQVQTDPRSEQETPMSRIPHNEQRWANISALLDITKFRRHINKDQHQLNKNVRTSTSSGPNFAARIWSFTRKAHFVMSLLLHILNLIRVTKSVIEAFLGAGDLMLPLCQATNQIYFATLFVFSSCMYRKYFNSLLTNWLKYEAKYGISATREMSSRHNRYVFCSIIFVLLLQGIALFVGTVYFMDTMYLQTWPFNKYESSGRKLTAILTGSLNFFSFCSMLSANSIRGIFVAVLQYEFKLLQGKLYHILADTTTDIASTEAKFDAFLDHLKCLNDLVGQSYGLLKHTIASTFIFTIPLYCFIIYGIVSQAMKWDQLLQVSSTVFISTIALLNTCIGCGNLYTQACSVWETPYAVSWKTFSPSLLHKLSVFMNQFRVQDIGFSLYGMFTVTRSTLLMVLGTILTYSIIVIQFELDSANRCRDFNKTG